MTTLVELQQAVDEADSVCGLIRSQMSGFNSDLQSLNVQIRQAQKIGDLQTVLSLEPQAQAAAARLQTALAQNQQAADRLAAAKQSHKILADKIKSLDYGINELNANLKPTGLHAVRIKKCEWDLQNLHNSKAADERSLAELQAKRAGLVGASVTQG